MCLDLEEETTDYMKKGERGEVVGGRGAGGKT